MAGTFSGTEGTPASDRACTISQALTPDSCDRRTCTAAERTRSHGFSSIERIWPMRADMGREPSGKATGRELQVCSQIWRLLMLHDLGAILCLAGVRDRAGGIPASPATGSRRSVVRRESRSRSGTVLQTSQIDTVISVLRRLVMERLMFALPKSIGPSLRRVRVPLNLWIDMAPLISRHRLRSQNRCRRTGMGSPDVATSSATMARGFIA
jgi:hypothetical protein